MDLEGIIIKVAAIKAGCIPNPDLVWTMWKKSIQFHNSCYRFDIFTCVGEKISNIFIVGVCYKTKNVIELCYF